MPAGFWDGISQQKQTLTLSGPAVDPGAALSRAVATAVGAAVEFAAYDLADALVLIHRAIIDGTVPAALAALRAVPQPAPAPTTPGGP